MTGGASSTWRKKIINNQLPVYKIIKTKEQPTQPAILLSKSESDSDWWNKKQQQQKQKNI